MAQGISEVVIVLLDPMAADPTSAIISAVAGIAGSLASVWLKNHLEQKKTLPPQPVQAFSQADVSTAPPQSAAAPVTQQPSGRQTSKAVWRAKRALMWFLAAVGLNLTNLFFAQDIPGVGGIIMFFTSIFAMLCFLVAICYLLAALCCSKTFRRPPQ